MKCLMCGEEYTREEIKELRKMREEFYHDGSCFFCPDCYDHFSRLPLEEQSHILLEAE